MRHHNEFTRGVDLESRSLTGKIAATEATDQPGRWVLAEELHVGDVLLGQSNQLFPIEEISSVTLPMPMYNFHVEELENYCVGSCGFLVHNTNEPCDGTPPGNGKPDYTAIPDPKDVEINKDPTRRQVREMKRLNREHNGGVLRDDVTGEVMVDATQSKKGVTPPSNEVQVDHITPKSKGGSRSSSNLELRTRENNGRKSDKLPGE